MHEIFFRKRLKFEIGYQFVLLTLLIIWYVVVRASVIGLDAVLLFQNYFSPFLFVAIFAMFATAILSTRKINYFFQIETKKRYPNTKFGRKEVKPYYAEFASPVEKAQHYNKGLGFEIYPIAFLLFFSGRTVFGIVFAVAYLVYFSIANYKRVFVTEFVVKKRSCHTVLKLLLLPLCCFFALYSSESSIFAMIFELVNLEKLSYHMNFITFYIALILTIPSMIIRSQLKKHSINIKSDNEIKQAVQM